MTVSLTAPTHVRAGSACTACHRAVELECEGLPGFWGYRTYNDFFCPFCRKLNHALTSGAVVCVRPLP